MENFYFSLVNCRFFRSDNYFFVSAMKRTLFYIAFILIQYISIINGDVDEIEVSPEEFFAVRDALNFKGKVVLISGSSSGIGATTARLFSVLGARVVITGRNLTRINEVVSDCHQLSPSKYKVIIFDSLDTKSFRSNISSHSLWDFN